MKTKLPILMVLLFQTIMFNVPFAGGHYKAYAIEPTSGNDQKVQAPSNPGSYRYASAAIEIKELINSNSAYNNYYATGTGYPSTSTGAYAVTPPPGVGNYAVSPYNYAISPSNYYATSTGYPSTSTGSYAVTPPPVGGDNGTPTDDKDDDKPNDRWPSDDVDYTAPGHFELIKDGSYAGKYKFVNDPQDGKTPDPGNVPNQDKSRFRCLDPFGNIWELLPDPTETIAYTYSSYTTGSGYPSTSTGAYAVTNPPGVGNYAVSPYNYAISPSNYYATSTGYPFTSTGSYAVTPPVNTNNVGIIYNANTGTSSYTSSNSYPSYYTYAATTNAGYTYNANTGPGTADNNPKDPNGDKPPATKPDELPYQLFIVRDLNGNLHFFILPKPEPFAPIPAPKDNQILDGWGIVPYLDKDYGELEWGLVPPAEPPAPPKPKDNIEIFTEGFVRGPDGEIYFEPPATPGPPAPSPGYFLDFLRRFLMMHFGRHIDENGPVPKLDNGEIIDFIIGGENIGNDLMDDNPELPKSPELPEFENLQF